MFKVFFTQGNGEHCHCCRSEYLEREEYVTRSEALSRAADLKAHAYWGQDVTGVGVQDKDDKWIGLDNKGFEARVRSAIKRVSADYVNLDGAYDPLEAREC
jgi:hypothetical protein